MPRYIPKPKKYAKAKKIICPACEHGYTTVLDSRRWKRLRECDACGARWLTDEVFDRFVQRHTRNIPKASLRDDVPDIL